MLNVGSNVQEEIFSPNNVGSVWQMGRTCWQSLRDRMKGWLRVSRWACDCRRCVRASSKVISAGSFRRSSPLPSPPLFLLFSPSWRRALVARFITSDLAWMLSCRQNRMDGRHTGTERKDGIRRANWGKGVGQIEGRGEKRGAQVMYRAFISNLTS